ncbi:MAG: TonB-dependent receptor plug domain-containing protein, partial [Myxococcota bacterium]
MLFADIPIVVGASKHEQRVSDAPASVTIVTAEQIQRFGWRTLAEILEGVRGIHITRDRNYAFAGMRGFSPPGAFGERVLILIDGFRFNNVFYDGGNADRNLPIDVADIDRIEIIPGPGSALYGTNAVLGVVNIITRRGRDLKGGEVAVVGGSYNTLGGHTSWGTRFDSDLEVLVAAGGRWAEGQDHYYGYFDRPLRNNGIAEDLDAEWDFDTLAKVGFRDLQVEAFWGTREKEIPTASYSTYFNGQRTFT